MTSPTPAAVRLEALCDEIIATADDARTVESARAVRLRLQEPLRVAIVGRVKAGKSTLLNALIGEHLAPTDAGECTRVVTWFRHGPFYDVTAQLEDGSALPVSFTRDEGALSYRLPASPPAPVARVEVSWPSARLRQLTFVDTPGLGSVDPSVSHRTSDFFAVDDAHQPGEADAVIYLLRHAHRSDTEFLEAFADRSFGIGSPVNAIGVLSRADEVGVGRLDAMASARSIAGRYAASDRLWPLISDCVAVAGLVGEAAATLTEAEAATLREIASLDAEVRNDLLISVDRFLELEAGSVAVQRRRRLLARLGMFGVRFALRAILEDRSSSATDLARELYAVSGVEDLRLLLEGRFMARAGTLKCRSAVASLRAALRDLAARDRASADDLRARLEALEASSHELAELRVLHLLRGGELAFTEAETIEVESLMASTEPADRLGLQTSDDPELLRAFALQAIARWRERAGSPLTPRETATACETIARTYEGLYVAIA